MSTSEDEEAHAQLQIYKDMMKPTSVVEEFPFCSEDPADWSTDPEPVQNLDCDNQCIQDLENSLVNDGVGPLDQDIENPPANDNSEEQPIQDLENSLVHDGEEPANEDMENDFYGDMNEDSPRKKVYEAKSRLAGGVMEIMSRHKVSIEGLEAFMRCLNREKEALKTILNADAKFPEKIESMRKMSAIKVPTALTVSAWRRNATNEIVTTKPLPVLPKGRFPVDEYDLLYEYTYLKVKNL